MILLLRIKGVRGKGNVKVSYDVNHNVLVAQKIHMRYLGNLEHPMAHELIDAIKKGQSVVLEISPKYYSTGTTVNSDHILAQYDKKIYY